MTCALVEQQQAGQGLLFSGDAMPAQFAQPHQAQPQPFLPAFGQPRRLAADAQPTRQETVVALAEGGGKPE